MLLWEICQIWSDITKSQANVSLLCWKRGTARQCWISKSSHREQYDWPKYSDRIDNNKTYIKHITISQYENRALLQQQMRLPSASYTKWYVPFKQETKALNVHESKVNEITSWHLISASFCTPMGVCRSDTWKFSTSMSDAPNVASTFTLSCMRNWTFLLVMERRHRRKVSLSTDRACCSIGSCSAFVSDEAEVAMEVRQRAMKRGDLGSNPRLLGSGPFGRRSTDTGVAMLNLSANIYERKTKFINSSGAIHLLLKQNSP